VDLSGKFEVDENYEWKGSPTANVVTPPFGWKNVYFGPKQEIPTATTAEQALHGSSSNSK
jgi:hypothetical protein